MWGPYCVTAGHKVLWWLADRDIFILAPPKTPLLTPRLPDCPAEGMRTYGGQEESESEGHHKVGKCWKNHHLIIDLQPRSFSPLQRFTLAEMTRRRKGKKHLNRTKQLKKLKSGKYLQSGNEGFGKIDLRDNRVDHTEMLRKAWRGALPNNIEILGEIARIVTSTRILSGKIKKSSHVEIHLWIRVQTELKS